MPSRGLDYFLNIKAEVNGDKEVSKLNEKIKDFTGLVGKKTKPKVFKDAKDAIKDFDKASKKSTTNLKGGLSSLKASFRNVGNSIKNLGKKFTSFSKKASKSLSKVGTKFRSVGKGLTVGLTAPIAALGAISLFNYDKQVQAIAQIEAGLKSTGGTAGFTSKELQKIASEMQAITVFGDEDILSDVTAQLLTFANISKDAFVGTQLQVLNLATRMKGDLKGAALQLGKALNDPVTQLSALGRAGITFSEDQKAVIKSLVETNQLASAQALVLKELGTQFGSSAEAAAKVGLGPFRQFKNSLGDTLEGFGKLILEGINPFLLKTKEMLDKFNNLSPATKKFVFIIGGLLAAIGPLVFLVGTLSAGLGLAAAGMPILISGFVGFKAIVISSVVSLKTFKGALIGTGIGALVVALGLAVEYLTALTFEMGGFKNAIDILSLRFTLFVKKLSLGFQTLKQKVKESVGGVLGIKVGASFDKSRAETEVLRAKAFLIAKGLEIKAKLKIDEKQPIIKSAKQSSQVNVKSEALPAIKPKFDINSFLTPVQIAEAKAKLNNLNAELANSSKAQLDRIKIEGLGSVKVATVEAEESLTRYYEKFGDQKSLGALNSIKNKLIGIRTEQLALKEVGLAEKLSNDLGGVDSVADKLTDTFSDAIDGTKSLGEALGSLFDDLFRDLTKLALKKAITEAISSTFSKGGPVLALADGGKVTGAGSETSDSIVARLSNNEYVINARASKAVGFDFLDKLNSIGKTNSNGAFKNGFAEGGIVDGAEKGSTKIELINRGSEKQASKVESRTEGRDTIISVLINDLNTNGPVAQSFGSTFGVRR